MHNIQTESWSVAADGCGAWLSHKEIHGPELLVKQQLSFEATELMDDCACRRRPRGSAEKTRVEASFATRLANLPKARALTHACDHHALMTSPSKLGQLNPQSRIEERHRITKGMPESFTNSRSEDIDAALNH